MALFGFGKKKDDETLRVNARAAAAQDAELEEDGYDADFDGEAYFLDESVDLDTLEEGGMIVAENVFAVKGRGLAVTGTVSAGYFQVGDRVEVRKANGVMIATQVLAIDMQGQGLDRAEVGQSVGIILQAVPGLAMRIGDSVLQMPLEDVAGESL